MRNVRYEIEDMVWYDEQDRVACLIEEEVGTRFGWRPRTMRSVKGEVWVQARNKVAVQVRGEVEDRAWDQVWNEVWEPVWNPVRNQVEDEVWDRA